MAIQDFTYSFNNTTLWVGVTLEYDGTNVHITNIQFEGEGKTHSEIPQNPNFNQEEGKWYLFENSISNLNGIETMVSQKIDNEHTKHLVCQILKVKEDATPSFFD